MIFERKSKCVTCAEYCAFVHVYEPFPVYNTPKFGGAENCMRVWKERPAIVTCSAPNVWVVLFSTKRSTLKFAFTVFCYNKSPEEAEQGCASPHDGTGWGHRAHAARGRRMLLWWPSCRGGCLNTCPASSCGQQQVFMEEHKKQDKCKVVPSQLQVFQGLPEPEVASRQSRSLTTGGHSWLHEFVWSLF